MSQITADQQVMLMQREITNLEERNAKLVLDMEQWRTHYKHELELRDRELERRDQQIPDLIQKIQPQDSGEGKRKILEAIDIGSVCSVCLDVFQRDQDAAVTKCKHIYHRACLKKWMETHDSCPICRHDVVRWSFYLAPIV